MCTRKGGRRHRCPVEGLARETGNVSQRVRIGPERPWPDPFGVANTSFRSPLLHSDIDGRHFRLVGISFILPIRL